jgi:hypothetical protein
VSFETYWLLVPSVGTIVVLIGCLVLWLTRPQRAAAANKADDERQRDLFRHAPS